MTDSHAPAGSLDVKRVLTLGAATVLIAVQTIAGAVAGGWAIAGFFGLGDIGAYVLEGLGFALGVWAVTKFVASALANEPLRTPR